MKYIANLLVSGAVLIGAVNTAHAQQDEVIIIHSRIINVDVQDPTDTGVNAGDEWYVVDYTNRECYTPFTPGTNIERQMRGPRNVLIPPDGYNGEGQLASMSGTSVLLGMWEEGGSRDRYGCLEDPQEAYDFEVDEIGSDERLFVMRLELYEGALYIGGTPILGLGAFTWNGNFTDSVTYIHNPLMLFGDYAVTFRFALERRSTTDGPTGF